MPPDLQRKVSCHDLKQTVDKYNKRATRIRAAHRTALDELRERPGSATGRITQIFMNTETSLPPANPRFAASGLFCFRWWYKGRTVEGNTMKLEGRVVATDASAACDKVEKQMRAKWPTVRWMKGKEIEGDGVTFGPTVQKLKTPVEARKQNVKSGGTGQQMEGEGS